jgi:hypothetical protein
MNTAYRLQLRVHRVYVHDVRRAWHPSSKKQHKSDIPLLGDMMLMCVRLRLHEVRGPQRGSLLALRCGNVG